MVINFSIERNVFGDSVNFLVEILQKRLNKFPESSIFVTVESSEAFIAVCQNDTCFSRNKQITLILIVINYNSA